MKNKSGRMLGLFEAFEMNQNIAHSLFGYGSACDIDIITNNWEDGDIDLLIGLGFIHKETDYCHKFVKGGIKVRFMF